jgi:molecular chaperone IbpA
MKHFDFTPLFRLSIGFDRLVYVINRLVEKDLSSTYPPYNIERFNMNKYVITMAVAGFSTDDLEIIVEERVLGIYGKIQKPTQPLEYLHHGIAGRSFQKFFQLADYIKVTDACLEDGLLQVTLEGEAPEVPKAIKIKIIEKKEEQKLIKHN